MFFKIICDYFYNKKYLKEDFQKEILKFGKIDIELHIHKAESNKIIIIYPGADGSIDGYNNKYKRIANWLSDKKIATVIRLDNKYCIDRLPYVEMIIAKLAFVIEYVLENPERFSNDKNFELCLAGISAGAGAVATLFADYPEIKKALLIAPYDSVGLENILRGLKKYSGEVYFIAGANDEIKTHEKAKLFYDVCLYAKKKIAIIPKCDHRFAGAKNGKIFSNAFIWAFTNYDGNPNHRDGVRLY